MYNVQCVNVLYMHVHLYKQAYFARNDLVMETINTHISPTKSTLQNMIPLNICQGNYKHVVTLQACYRTSHKYHFTMLLKNQWPPYIIKSKQVAVSSSVDIDVHARYICA